MLIAFLSLSPALANERFFAWSYGAATVAEGTMELEPISTRKLPLGGDAQWTHEVELEFGITSSLEGGLYLVSKQEGAGALTFAAYKARLRYRPLPLGTLPVDLAVYLEYIGSPTLDSHGAELKLIAAREGKALRAALNATFELETGPEGLEMVLEPTAGVMGRATSWLALGAEGKFEAVLVPSEGGPYAWAGPSIHLAGTDGALNGTVSVLYGLTPASRDDAAIQARVLLGIHL